VPGGRVILAGTMLVAALHHPVGQA
jgi:hypothetical protein